MSILPSLQIFRAGTHTDSNSRTLTFAEADLAATAAAYDPAKHEAPLVVGHPALDAPAYGWVHSLTSAQGALEATPQQVDAAFAEMVQEGRFKKISASFWLPDAPGNPTPGVYYLRHVGFLGAAAPAVKGLRTPAFSSDKTGVVEFSAEFSTWTDRAQLDLWRGLREWLLTQFGADAADQVVPTEALANLQADVEQAAVERAVESVSPSPLQDSLSMSDSNDLAAREAAISAREAAVAEQEAQLQAQIAAQRRRDITAFAEAQVKAGKVLPRQQAGLIELLLALPEAPLEFAEAGQTVKTEPRAWLEGFLAALPAQVDYAERSAGTAIPLSAPSGPASRKEFEALTPKARADFLGAGGTITD